jgi:hypothetical protein
MKKGYLYMANEEIKENYIRIHPACKENDSWEYIINGDLKIIGIKE